LFCDALSFFSDHLRLADRSNSGAVALDPPPLRRWTDIFLDPLAQADGRRHDGKIVQEATLVVGAP
jgi:hypothetical protein